MASNPTTNSKDRATSRKPGFTVPQVQPSRRREAEPPDEPPQEPAAAATPPTPPAVSDEVAPAEQPNDLVPTAPSGGGFLPGRPVPQQHQEVPVAPLDSAVLAPPPSQPLLIRTRSGVVSLRVDEGDAEWWRRISRMGVAHYDLPEGVLSRIVMMMLKENIHEIFRQAVLAAKGEDIGPPR